LLEGDVGLPRRTKLLLHQTILPDRHTIRTI
jgi:hypothetical protein